jgi:hypothetical protein
MNKHNRLYCFVRCILEIIKTKAGKINWNGKKKKKFHFKFFMIKKKLKGYLKKKK